MTLAVVLGLVGTATPLALATIYGLVWLVRLEGRVTASEQVDAAHRAEILRRLARIEQKLDAANGSTRVG